MRIKISRSQTGLCIDLNTFKGGAVLPPNPVKLDMGGSEVDERSNRKGRVRMGFLTNRASEVNHLQEQHRQLTTTGFSGTLTFFYEMFTI